MKRFIELDQKYNSAEKLYSKLNKEKQTAIDKFVQYYLLTASEIRAKKAKRNVIRFLVMVDKHLKDINLEDLRAFLLELKQQDWSDYSKNDTKNIVARFLKWYFKDWSERFLSFEDVKYDHEAERKEKITPKDVLSEDDVKDLIEKAPKLFWKTFISVQYEGALRTQEARLLRWEDINTDDNECYWLTIGSKKNQKGKERKRIIPVQSSIHFLNMLRKEQEYLGIKKDFVFRSPKSEQPISAGSVNTYFNRITKRVLGKTLNNYLLRHSRGEEFHKLVRDGKMSKENATRIMGHSEEMFDKTYSHPDKKQLKEVLKKQVFNIEDMPPERKHKLEQEVAELKKQLEPFIKEKKKFDDFVKSEAKKILDKIREDAEKRYKTDAVKS